MIATVPLALTREDLVLLYKWGERQLAEVSIAEEAVQEGMQQVNAIRQAYEQQVVQEHEAFAALADNADLYTDAGFFRLAREYSEGSEASSGGVIETPMTRAEIAAANAEQPFTTPVGETSTLIDTPAALRFIRVLEELPSAEDGAPARLRIAQILYVKKELGNLPDEEQIRTSLKYQAQEKYIGDMLETLAVRYHFSCPIFPDLLDMDRFQEAVRQLDGAAAAER